MEFSVIITTDYSSDGINETVDSIINQDLGFDDNIEIIVIDTLYDTEARQKCGRYIEDYPENFKFIEINDGISRNVGLKKAHGKYINFLNCGDKLSKNALKSVLEFFTDNEGIDIVSIPVSFINNPISDHWSNRRFNSTKITNLMEEPENYQPFGPSSFIKKDSLENREFKQVFRNDSALVNEILIGNPNLGLCKKGQLESQLILEKNPFLQDAQATKSYYVNLCKNYFKNLIELSLDRYGEVPKFIQNILMYDIGIMLTAENTEDILNENEIEEFKASMKYILIHVDDEVIFNNNIMDDYLKIHTFILKNGTIDESLLLNFDLNTVFVDIYEIINDKLHIMANIPNVFKRDVDVFINGSEIKAELLKFPQRNHSFFNYTFAEDYSFEFDVNIEKNMTYEIQFKINGAILDIDFSRPCNFSKVAGYAKTKDYLSVLKGNKIVVEKKTTLKWIKQEIKTLIKMIKEREPGFHVGIPFRIAYMLGYPFLKNKHIWFFMDRPESADDNGMHIFKYAMGKHENIQKYFILKKDSPDFEDLKKIGKTIPFKSLKHRYLGLFVENIITSHPDNQIIYPFWGTFPHLAGLLKSNTAFLQHGILKDDISSWLNKSDMNLSMFVTSSPKEYESVFENPYNYNENVVQLTGLPRYDNLKNEEDKKQVIIMPSWRRYLTNKSKKYISNTEYFKRFNSLINNEEIIKVAKENNYEIIFKPHPNVYEFIELFDRNDYVKIDYNTKYQTLFNNGSLLITDYSSIAFDFAYLYKPMIYYQYKDDYHFDVETGYFKYEEVGFGEICKEETELTDLIIEYIKNDCKLKSKYEKRIKDFFLFTDRNNCKRVYDKIKEIPLKD